MTVAAPERSLFGQDITPYLPPKKEKPARNWDKVFITTVVVAVLAGLVAALAAVCYMGIFPEGLLGGSNATFLTLCGAGFVAVVSAAFAFYRWKTS